MGIARNLAANSAAENATTWSSSANNGGVGTTLTLAQRMYGPPHLRNRPPVSDSLVAYGGIVSCSDHLGMVAQGGVVVLERERERERVGVKRETIGDSKRNKDY